MSYLEDIASESSIICVTESHLDGNILDNDITIDGFSEKYLEKIGTVLGVAFSCILLKVFVWKKDTI